MNIQKIIIIGFLTFLSNFLVAQVFTNYTSETSDLSDNLVNGGVAIDQDNNKWFGTVAGVAKFDDVSWTIYNTANDGLADDYTLCIAVDANNNVWVGTEMGASKFDGTTWTNYTTAEGLPANVINDICGDSNGNVWFATLSGLSKYDGTNFTNYTDAEGLSTSVLTCLSLDSQDNIWIGTYGEGISKFDGTNFTNLETTTGILDSTISTIFVDHNDNKWAGTLHGVSVFNSSDAWTVNYVAGDDGLYREQVKDIKEDSQGNIWIGSILDYLQQGGLTKFDGTTWVSYDMDDGLVDYYIKEIAIDDQDVIWIATGNGVSKLEIPTKVQDVDFNNQINIYPNPASQTLNLEIGNDLDQDNNKIEILNSLGQTMNEYYVNNNDKLSISLENYSNGIYLINTGQNTLKFIVNK